MAVSKVVYGNTTLIDLTTDTVTAGDLAAGVTAHGADGNVIVGTNDYDSNTSDADGVCEHEQAGRNDAEPGSSNRSNIDGVRKLCNPEWLS